MLTWDFAGVLLLLLTYSGVSADIPWLTVLVLLFRVVLSLSLAVSKDFGADHTVDPAIFRLRHAFTGTEDNGSSRCKSAQQGHLSEHVSEINKETFLRQMRSSSANHPCGWTSQFGVLNRSLDWRLPLPTRQAHLLTLSVRVLGLRRVVVQCRRAVEGLLVPAVHSLVWRLVELDTCRVSVYPSLVRSIW